MREDCKQILCIIKTMECFLFVRCHIMSPGLFSIPICNKRFNIITDFVIVQWHTRPSFPNMDKNTIPSGSCIFVLQLNIVYVCTFIITGNVDCEFGNNWVNKKPMVAFSFVIQNILVIMIDGPLKL